MLPSSYSCAAFCTYYSHIRRCAILFSTLLFKTVSFQNIHVVWLIQQEQEDNDENGEESTRTETKTKLSQDNVNSVRHSAICNEEQIAEHEA